jgi:hypothetical protein
MANISPWTWMSNSCYDFISFTFWLLHPRWLFSPLWRSSTSSTNLIALKFFNLESPIVHQQIVIYKHHPWSQHLTQSCISKWNEGDGNLYHFVLKRQPKRID